ncbi:serine hydrolase [Hymenobacter puniceus]|uniref:serine hydrolase n=1 Tax=Hymenobacter sp. BT190 TaxID=2763505 RepID=UPI001650E791|nr:serine hydrolase [Hymenobacter sp. BT190]MBC6700516.1 serine hydrolase [Hymenobacter sp. BT190]
MLLHWLALPCLATGQSAIDIPSYVAPHSTTQQTANSPLLDSLLHTDPQLARIADNPHEYELQIIYTQINRDEYNQPHFVQHNFQVDAHRYFNPASLVKLPTAALALEKLNQLAKPGLTRHSPMATRTAFRCQTAAPYNPAADPDRLNTVGNYIKRMLLVSDNNAYNRLYEFLGQRPLNERLAQLGYADTRIVRRFAPCNPEANRHTNPIDFFTPSGALLHQQPAATNPIPFNHPLGRITKGRAHQAEGRIVLQPFDFTTANYLSLRHITDMLKAIIFPQAIPVSQQFQLTPDDYSFLRYYLHHTPHGSGYKPYTASQYFDAYKKYLYYGCRPQAETRPSLHIYNVVGMSHGYLSDVAYFADAATQTEFLLSAVLYVNQDGIINDGAYDYTTIGLPFLEKLGQQVLQYEAHRPHEFAPDLSEFFKLEPIR